MADEKYSAPAELPRAPTLIRDEAIEAAAAVADHAPAPGAVLPGDESAPPPPRFPSMPSVALARADAVARANAAEQSAAAMEAQAAAAEGRYLKEEEEMVAAAGEGQVEGGEELGEGMGKGEDVLGEDVEGAGAKVGAFGGRRVMSGEIGESLKRNVVEGGSGARKAKEAGETVWGKQEQEDFDRLTSVQETRVGGGYLAAEGPTVPKDGDSSWIGGKAMLTKVERDEPDQVADVDDQAAAGVYEGAPMGGTLGSRVAEEEIEEEVLEEDVVGEGDEIEVEEDVVVEDSDAEEDEESRAAAVGAAANLSPSGKPQGDPVKRKSLAGGVAIPASAIVTDQAVSTGDNSWIGGGVSLTKAQKTEKEVEQETSFGREGLIAAGGRRDGTLGEEMHEVDQLGRENETEPEWVLKSRSLKSAAEDDEADLAQTADMAASGAREGARREQLVGTGDLSQEEQEEPEWIRKGRELKSVGDEEVGRAGVAAGEGTRLAASGSAASGDDRYEDEQPEWVRNRPVLAPAGSADAGDQVDFRAADATPPAVAPSVLADSSVLDTATRDADRGADLGASYDGNRIDSALIASSADAGTTTGIGASYAGDRIDSGLVASSADAGTTLDRRDDSSSSTAAAAGVAGAAGIIGAGGYSAMTRDSYTSQRSSTDSFATATGSALTGAPPPSSTTPGYPVNTNPGAIGLADESGNLLSGSSYSNLGAPEAQERAPIVETQEPEPTGHDNLLFSGPTSAPLPPVSDSKSVESEDEPEEQEEEEEMNEREHDERSMGTAGVAAAAVGGVGAAAAGAEAAIPSAGHEYDANGVGVSPEVSKPAVASPAPTTRLPAVTSVPMTQNQGRPVLSGQWADEDVDESTAHEDVVARHTSLTAGDPGINGAHVNITRDFGLFGGHADGVNDAAFVDPETLLTAGQDGKVCVWDIGSRYPKSEFVPYEGKPVTMLHVLPPDEETNSWTIMTLSEDRLMRIWNTTLERAVLLHSTQIPASKNDVVVSIPAISAKKRQRATAAAKAAAEAEAAMEQQAPEVEGTKNGTASGGVFSSFGLFNRRKDAVPA